MTDLPKAQVQLDFAKHWCARHLSPFRNDWPGGAGIAMLKLFEASVSDERIIAACPKDLNGLAQTESLNAVLLEHSPLCCFVGDVVMNDIYSLVGKEPPQ